MDNVVHVPSRSRFELEADGQVAFLSYEEGEGDVALLHTVVPPPAQREGVGSRLAQTAVRWAREQGLEIVPVCSFVQEWLQRHPEALER